MKVIFLLLLGLLTLTGNAQKVKSEIDKFTGQKRVKTRDCLFNDYHSFYLRSVDSSIYISFNNPTGAVDVGTPAIFLFTDKSKFEIYPTGFQLSIETYQQYRIDRAQLEQLRTKDLQAVRFQYSSSYSDDDIADRYLPFMKKRITAFLEEFDKKN